MEEPKKVVRAEYVGSLQVCRPSGMDVLNSAIENAVTDNPGPWDSVSVAVAPSTITITDIVSNSIDVKAVLNAREISNYAREK